MYQLRRVRGPVSLRTGDGEQAIAETALIPMLVKAVQELSAEVEELKLIWWVISLQKLNPTGFIESKFKVSPTIKDPSKLFIESFEKFKLGSHKVMGGANQRFRSCISSMDIMIHLS